MPLTKEQIIEIQSAAKFNTEKRIREAQEEKEYKEQLVQDIAEARSPRVDVSKKVKKEAKKDESKKGD